MVSPFQFKAFGVVANILRAASRFSRNLQHQKRESAGMASCYRAAIASNRHSLASIADSLRAPEPGGIERIRKMP